MADRLSRRSHCQQPVTQEAAGWEAALDQAARPAGETVADGQVVPDAAAPAADDTAAQVSGASAAALAALRAAEAEATRAAVLKARSYSSGLAPW